MISYYYIQEHVDELFLLSLGLQSFFRSLSLHCLRPFELLFALAQVIHWCNIDPYRNVKQSTQDVCMESTPLQKYNP